MRTQHFQGKKLDNSHSRICLLFDPKDGRVVHGHGVTVLQSAKHPEPAALEARARKLAHSLGKSVEGTHALHLPLEAIHGHRAFKVNASGDGIIPITRPHRHSTHGKSS